MEVREKYVARLLNDPETHGFTEIKFVHMPQIAIARWVRQRCQYLCNETRQSDSCPPFSPTAPETVGMLEEYKFGLLLRREVPMVSNIEFPRVWASFQDAMVVSENEAFVRGYGKAFAVGVGNCTFGHHDDSIRPCAYPGKRRPTLEAIGVNLKDTLGMVAWEEYLVRDDDQPFQIFGLLLLE